jgi:HSP20 family protein
MPEEEDRWYRWFRRRRPFFGGGLWDIDETFREMEEMMAKEFEELSKRTPKDLIRERTLPNGSKVKSWGPFVYGYSVTVGPDGKPKVREFGNLKPETRMGKPYIDVKEKREPLADIMTDDNEVRVIVELPGVEKKDIKLSGTEDKLTISVDTATRKYYKEIELPTEVEIKKATSKYKNGVLDITIPKKKEEKPKGETINIE